MSDVLQRIAPLANSLSHAELRVLLELAVRAEASGAAEIMASSCHLAQSTGLARASVQAAIDSLKARQLIRSNAGSPTQPAAHCLLCLHANKIGSGLTTEPEVAQPASHPGLVSEPPRDEKSVTHAEHIKKRACVRIRSITKSQEGRFRQVAFRSSPNEDRQPSREIRPRRKPASGFA